MRVIFLEASSASIIFTAAAFMAPAVISLLASPAHLNRRTFQSVDALHRHANVFSDRRKAAWWCQTWAMRLLLAAFALGASCSQAAECPLQDVKSIPNLAEGTCEARATSESTFVETKCAEEDNVRISLW